MYDMKKKSCHSWTNVVYIRVSLWINGYVNMAPTANAFYWPSRRHTTLRKHTLWHCRWAWHCKASMDWNNGHILAHHHYIHRIFSAWSTDAIGFDFGTVMILNWKCKNALCYIFRDKYWRQNCARIHFALWQVKVWFRQWWLLVSQLLYINTQ